MRTSSRAAVAVVALGILSTAGVSAGEPVRDKGTMRKAAWEWSDSDRLAARLNDDEAAARVRAHAAATPRIQSNDGRVFAATPYDTIVGKRDPHLYFRAELFDHLASAAFVDDTRTREVYREMREEICRKLGLPDHFWLKLEAITAAYRADRRLEREIGRSSLSAEQKQAQRASIAAKICRDRQTAMAEAATAFGPAFERFLYVSVAETLSTTMLRKPDEQFRAYVMGECR